MVRQGSCAALGLALIALRFASPAALAEPAASDGKRDRAAAALTRAETLRREGRRDTVGAARALYAQAIESFRAARDSCGVRRALVALSGFEHDNMNATEQKAAAQAALAARCAADIDQQALAERLLGSADINTGDYTAGARETERAVALYERAHDTGGETEALRNLGLAYEESGELGKALATTRRALAGAERSGDARLLALIRNDMALDYNERGEFARAIEAYRKALDALRSEPYPMAETVAWINLGVAYGQLGDSGEAETAYEKGAAVAARIDCWSCLAEIDIDRGDDLLDADQSAQAEPAYRHALSLATAHQLVRQHAEALRGLGRCALGAEHWGEARSELEAARQALSGTSERLNESLIDVALGDLEDKRGRPAAAQQQYERALALAEEAANETWQAIALGSLARVAEESGALELARRRIDRAIALIESERTQINAPELRTSYFGTKRSYYALCIDVLMRLEQQRPGRGYAADALIVAERARARALQDALLERAVSLDRSVDPRLLQAEGAAADRLHALAYQMTRSEAQEEGRRRSLQREMDEAMHVLDAARGRIRAANPRYAELVHPAPLSVAEIERRLLDSQTTVLEYWLGDEQSYLWVVRTGSLQALILPSASRVDSAAAALRGALREPATASVPLEQRAAFDAANADAVRSRARALAHLVLPSKGAGAGRQVLAVVADGGLETVPFAVLCSLDRSPPRPSSAACPADGAIVYLPSLATLRDLRTLPRSAAPHRAVAVIADPVFRRDDPRLRPAQPRSAGPAATRTLPLRAAGEAVMTDLPRLPYTREEAHAIASLADPHSSWVALDFAASREAVLAARWQNYSIVHFATHALLNARHPELSGIVLSLYDAQGRADDGFLRANDLYALDMPADLVVLSVCESGVGKDIGAEGPATLARALFYAGAHRVLATLWRVDDRASVAFMRSFYQAMLVGRRSPQAALAAAQREMQRNPRWDVPYYWAPYVLTGDWR